MKKLWHRLFLEERPSIALSAFRIAVAFTVWSVVFPSLVHLKELYFPGAFKEYNPSFFPVWFLELVSKSPEGLIVAFAVLFHVSVFLFLIGFLSQLSCILMTASCYYFYALNSYHVSTLTWDILMVTLFMMCVTGYHGDYFSVDALLRNGERPFERRRPYFVQRLLQMQLAFTLFYTALYKTTAEGNWLSDNPLFYVVNYPPTGVTKTFLAKDFIRTMPEFVYWSGIAIVIVEYLMPVLLWWRKTRTSAIFLGIFFQTLLMLTLDVPATFFFLFIPMFLLFINPEEALDWINKRRERNASGNRPALLYDGSCGFCKGCVGILKKMDLFASLDYRDFYEYIDRHKVLPAGLTQDDVLRRMYLIEDDNERYGGYTVFRRIAWAMPMMWPLIPVIFFPGMGIVGPVLYDAVAKNRKCLLPNRNTDR